jgi:hypothetical protein
MEEWRKSRSRSLEWEKARAVPQALVPDSLGPESASILRSPALGPTSTERNLTDDPVTHNRARSARPTPRTGKQSEAARVVATGAPHPASAPPSFALRRALARKAATPPTADPVFVQ